MTQPGQYPLADVTYANLLDRLAKNKFADLTPELRAAVLDFYKDPNDRDTMKKKKKEWNKLQAEVQQLKTTQAASGN